MATGLKVVPQGPVADAVDLARRAPADFFAAGYPTWQWMFQLARRLRGVKGVRQDTEPWLLKSAVKAFHVRALEVLGESDSHFLSADDFDDRFAEFLDVWHSVRVPEGQDVVDVAFAEAQRVYVLPTAKGPSTRYIVLLSVAYHLQCRAGSEAVIQLPVKRLGRLLGQTPQHVASLLRLAVRSGLLELVDGSSSYTERERAPSGSSSTRRVISFDSAVGDEGVLFPFHALFSPGPSPLGF